MKNKYLLITVGIFFLSCFIVLFKGLENPNIYKPNFKQGKSLPEFESLEFYSNKKILTSEIFINKSFYLVNIWASWCIPCRTEHSYLNKLKKEKFPNIQIQNYYYFPVGRWDIQFFDKKIIKFPSNNIHEAIIKSIELLKREDFKNYKIIDLRVSGKIIVE